MKKLIALCLVATFLVVFSSGALAATRTTPRFALTASVLTQPANNSPEDTVSTWDRIWPVLIAVGSFVLFRYLRSRPTHDDD